jgi:hypothetical protein
MKKWFRTADTSAGVSVRCNHISSARGEARTNVSMLHQRKAIGGAGDLLAIDSSHPTGIPQMRKKRESELTNDQFTVTVVRGCVQGGRRG